MARSLETNKQRINKGTKKKVSQTAVICAILSNLTCDKGLSKLGSCTNPPVLMGSGNHLDSRTYGGILELIRRVYKYFKYIAFSRLFF